MVAMTEKGAPGITIQLRQRQGQTALQEVFDSLSYASKMLGRLLIRYITGFSKVKIKRILGDDFKFTKQMKALAEQMQALHEQIEQIAEAELPAPNTPIPNGPVEKMALAKAENDGERADIEQGIMMRKQEADQAELEKQNKAREEAIKPIKQQMEQLSKQIAKINEKEDQFWEDFDKIRLNSRFDADVDEMANNQTYKSSILAMLSQAKQYQVQVPDEIFMQFMEMPDSAKEAWAAYIEQTRALQMQKAQADQALAQAKTMESQMEMQRAQLKAQTEVSIAKIKAEVDLKIAQAENMTKLEIAHVGARVKSRQTAAEIADRQLERQEAGGQEPAQPEPASAEAPQETAPAEGAEYGGQA